MTNQDRCITITNLSTGEERTYSLPIRDALISAVESDKGKHNTWTYPTAEATSFDVGSHGTVALGDWCGFEIKK